jgi:hypothetical protein
MDEQRKYVILFAPTILAARKLNDIGDRPCPARERAIADAIENAKRIFEKIHERWPEKQPIVDPGCRALLLADPSRPHAPEVSSESTRRPRGPMEMPKCVD